MHLNILFLTNSSSTLRKEIKQEPDVSEDHNSSYEVDYTVSVPFVDPDQEINIKREISDDSDSDSDYSDPSPIPSPPPKPSTSSAVKKSSTYVSKPSSSKIKSEPSLKQEDNPINNNDWSDDDDVPLTSLKDDFEFQPPSPQQKSQLPRRLRAKLFREKLTEAELRAGGVAFGKHKMRKLVGVPACRYCDSIFTDRKERDAHDCKYLKCDPKNFICRFCGKELSRKTFSNHVHESAACQYCGKKVLNPRQMKKHIQSRHKGELRVIYE